MSIINDALKKTQKALHQAPEPAPAHAPQAHKNTRVLTIVLIALIGFAGLGLAFMLALSARNRSAVARPTVPSAQQASGDSVTMVTKPTAVHASTNAAEKTLVLNGIITMDGDQFALINNQIFEAGDYIDTRRIVKIDADSVEIFDEGEIIVLRTGN